MIILFDSKFKNPGSAMTSCIINDDVIKMSHFWVKLWYDMEGRWGGPEFDPDNFFSVFYHIWGLFELRITEFSSRVKNSNFRSPF